MTLPETPRLKMRLLTEEDKEALIPILSDSAVMKFSTGPLTKEGIEAWLNNKLESYERLGFSVWAVILKEEDKLIGFCGFSAVELDGQLEMELVFRFAKAYWGQGFATEAAEACQQYSFDTLGFNRIIAVIDPKNERSLRVADKLNMTYEKDTVYKGFDVRVYSLNKF